MISINTPISDSSSLSAKANTILSWIPGAKYWLENAINDSTISYRFRSEEALIRSILTGLYSTEQIVLKNCDCSAAPEFLMNLTGDQINQITQGVEDSNVQKEPLIELLTQLNMVTGERLIQIQNLFHEWQVNENFLFQSLSIRNIQNLYQLVMQINAHQYDDAVVAGALDFAMQECVDASSFAHLMRYALKVYQTLYGSNNAKRLTATVKSKFNTIYQLLSALVVKRLSCPQLHPPQTAGDVGKILNLWGTQRQFVGFTDLATGLLQFITNIDTNQLLAEQTAQNAIQLFEQQYLQFLTVAKVTRQALSQDAQTWHYSLETSTQQADFKLIEDGCLTLDSFQQKISGEK